MENVDALPKLAILKYLLNISIYRINSPTTRHSENPQPQLHNMYPTQLRHIACRDLKILNAPLCSRDFNGTDSLTQHLKSMCKNKETEHEITAGRFVASTKSGSCPWVGLGRKLTESVEGPAVRRT